jgi:hypothetical protein
MTTKRALRIKALELAVKAVSAQPSQRVSVSEIVERYYHFLLTGEPMTPILAAVPKAS